jgi:hypothetical protein
MHDPLALQPPSELPFAAPLDVLRYLIMGGKPVKRLHQIPSLKAWQQTSSLLSQPRTLYDLRQVMGRLICRNEGANHAT